MVPPPLKVMHNADGSTTVTDMTVVDISQVGDSPDLACGMY